MCYARIIETVVALCLAVNMSAALAEQITHTYDAQSRLIRSEYSDGSGIEYVYDAAGNRVGQKAIADKPDLVVTALTGSASAYVGGTLDMTTALKNLGQRDAGAFWVVFYLSADSTITRDDVFTGTGCEYKNGLKAGAETTCKGPVKIPGALPPGSYYLGAYIDYYGTVEEGNENNNVLAAGSATVITQDEGPSYPLIVVKPGTGRVTSDPTGIDCGGPNKACRASFRVVTLTATPQAGYLFNQWVGCPAPSDNRCSLTLSSKTKVKAKFLKLPKYTLKIVKTKNGGIHIEPGGKKCKDAVKSCKAKFVAGTEVILTASPAPGRIFLGWDGGVCAGLQPCTLTMDGNKKVLAAFE